MAGRYERVSLSAWLLSWRPLHRDPALSELSQADMHFNQVNTQDGDDIDTPISATTAFARQQAIPNSPPPSFYSRSSSLERRRQQQQIADPTLADAFDADGDDSDDDEPDDRQRLVRQSSFPASTGSATSNSSSGDRPNAPDRQATQWPAASGGSNAQASTRTYGGGISGVFSNMMARPERGEKIVEEQPPVCETQTRPLCGTSSLTCLGRHTSKLQQTQHHHTGRQPSWHPASVALTRSTSMACPSAPSSALFGTA